MPPLPIDQLLSQAVQGEATFSPPPRFAAASFGSYRPANESQERAAARVAEFVTAAAAPARRGWWPFRRTEPGSGLYLDGGYGVGKTHLLAAAYHAAGDVKRVYLTFQELVHLIGARGAQEAAAHFEGVRLVCLDEFELDDPGNTLIVKRFLEGLFEAGGSLVTTSNTPPEAQGKGRFNAADFQREIQGIAQRFEVVPIDGPDFRKRERRPELHSEAEYSTLLPTLPTPAFSGTLDELLAVLREVHPIRFREIAKGAGGIAISGLETIASQNDALRFVHLIDQLYDQQVKLLATGGTPLSGLFDPSYRNGAYMKKHERCLSRVGELLDETRQLAGDGSHGDRPLVAGD